MIPKILLPALNLLVMSPSIWVALAAGAGFVFGVYFERKNLYASFTSTYNSKPTEPLSKSEPSSRIGDSSKAKPHSAASRKRRGRTSTR